MQAISEKIRSLDLSECKIRVLNVDSQSSYDNIVVQVIGEMSNKNQPHHKFVQTFILATQPNGYFVLNDIFRYLNEDEDEIVEDEPVPEETASVSEQAQSEQAPGEAVPVPTPAHAEEVVDTPAAVKQVDEELEAVKDEPTSTTEEVNGVDESVAEKDEPEPEPEVPAEPEEVAEEPAAPAVEEPAAPEPTPAQSPPPAPANEGPPARKTWASMVGTKAPIVPVVPQAQTPPTAASTTSSQSKPRPVSTAQQAKAPTESATGTDASTPTSQGNGWQEAGKKTRQQPKTQEGIVHAYIKNVNDKIDARVLREVLEKYGKLKYFDVSRPKVSKETQNGQSAANDMQQCAFVEFEDPAAYAAAVAENPHTVGTETVNVEERRPRPGQAGGFNGNYPRGGANAGRGRGGAQQPRSGSQGAGYNRDAAQRGNFQGARGGKPAGAARGRGQPQAA